MWFLDSRSRAQFRLPARRCGPRLSVAEHWRNAADARRANELRLYNEKMITITAQEGHEPRFERVLVRASSHWRFRGLQVSPENFAEVRALTGAHDSRIVNNTMLDPNRDLPGPAWIKVRPDKNGTPSAGVVVRNNLTIGIAIKGNQHTVADHNLLVKNPSLTRPLMTYTSGRMQGPSLSVAQTSLPTSTATKYTGPGAMATTSARTNIMGVKSASNRRKRRNPKPERTRQSKKTLRQCSINRHPRTVKQTARSS